jgi:photosystem II stability/assembly factor-like uncharacterized protein
MNDVYFIDANIGTAVGEYGTIIKTTNGGNNWYVQSTGKNYELKGVYFTDANNGTAVGFDNDGYGSNPFVGVILRTTNGGDNWIMQSSGVACMLNGVFFTDKNNGTVIGGGTDFGGGFGTILRTTDGGEHWFSQLCDTTTIAFRDVYFTDVNTGTVVGEGFWNGALQQYENKILRTKDGGKNWTNQNSGVTTPLHSVFFNDANVGWIVGGDGYANEGGVILRTIDGGSSWISQSIDVTTNGLYDICFTDTNTGTAVGSVWKDSLNTGWTEVIILRTIDGGKNWVKQPSGIKGRFSKLSFTDANTGTIVGPSESYPYIGNILRTTDGGASWINQTKGPTSYIWGVYFTDANNGTAVGEYGTILRTSDGGTNWVQKNSGVTKLLNDVCFIDANIGTVVGGGWDGQDKGIILRTTDGGNSWTNQSIGTTYGGLWGVSFTDVNNGITVGASGLILRTTNGGNNWINQSLGIYNYLTDVSFTDANTGTIVGEGGIILRTTNGGDSWLTQFSGTTNGLDGVCFTDVNTGWAVGWGTILKTTDGGKTWINKFKCKFNIYDVSFSDANNGVAVGNYMLRTTNGGETWITEIISTRNTLRGVCIVDALTGWVVGENGTIFHTTNGGGVPVELNSFTASANGKEVTLSWSTATELNNQGFEVQRKFGSNEFVAIGSVRGHGTTTSPNNYTYIDKLTDAGKYFYRLKQIDFGGKYEYSLTVEVNWSPFTSYKLDQNFPNPLNPSTTIGFGIPEKGNVRLSVLNILGEEIKILLNEEKEAGYHSIEFNASDLPSGVYFYKLVSKDFVNTKKMILVK